MEYITYCIANIIAAFLEKLRIKSSWGKTPNVKKIYSISIAVGLWLITLWIYNLWSWKSLIFGVACVGLRWLIYDPALNLFLGRKLDDVSETTNSKQDEKELKWGISFGEQRLYGGLISVIFYFLFYILYY